MKAFIMAAGYGTRLEPLTIAVPKPMVPIANLPTMQHNLELLAKYGFTEVCANIHYHPEQIENYFGDGESFGVSLYYSYEEVLQGTAGGVKKMATEILPVNKAFLVLSSDALTDINLERLVAFHKEKKALMTIALAEVNDVSEFGVVVTDENGRIIGFQEKPKPTEAKSNKVNAGIYVLEPEILDMIPDGPFDFGKQLLPRLAAEGAAIYGYPMVEYWSDVGSLDKYIRASYDAMEGRVAIKVPGKKVAAATWLGERERIDPSARFEGSVIIGNSCYIGKDVYIKDSVIGDKCVIAGGAVINGSVIWSDTVIQQKANITQAVIGSWCHIGAEASIGANTVIANRSLVKSRSIVLPQSRFKPNSII